MIRSESFKIRTIKLLSSIRYKILPIVEAPIDRFSLVGAGAFFDPALFPWAETLEANWQAIRQELDELLNRQADIPNFQDILPSQAELTTGQDWKTYFFYGYGYKMAANCRQCPETTRLIERVPGMKTAFFSILAPHKHIPAHRGFYKGVLRYHLGLIVPEPPTACRLRVGQDIRHWEEGRSLIFDDTFDHEVWNDTDGVRVVLFLDVVRPLPAPLAWLNELLIRLIALSPALRDAAKKQQPQVNAP